MGSKVKLKIFVPVSAFKKRSEVCFVMFRVNKYISYFIHLTFCADKVKIRDKTLIPCNKKSSP